MDFKKYHFIYNAAAYFAAQDKYPDGLINELGKGGTAGFDALCWALQEMSVQGELVRRDMGYDRGETLDAERLKRNMKFGDIVTARKIVTETMERGLKMPDEPTEVDEVLAEAQKKTGSNWAQSST